MVNSRQKGARGERQWAKRCRDEGFETARRGQQYSGNPDAPDVVCDDLPWCHFEVKTVERLNLQVAMNKAKEDCGDKAPVVAHKRNRHEWLVTMTADDWFAMAREYDGSNRQLED